jgi:hypothetical protein
VRFVSPAGATVQQTQGFVEAPDFLKVMQVAKAESAG